MKILQVVQFFSPNHGGSATSTYELSKQLQKDGHEVTVITTDFQMNNIFIDSLEGIKVIPFHCLFNIGGFLISPSMNKYLKENIDKFDIIHMNNFRTYQNIITRKYAIKHNVPYILQARGSIPLFGKSSRKKIFDYFFGNSLTKDARSIVASSKVESSYYLEVFPNLDQRKIVYVPNGINIENYCDLPKKGEFKKKYSIDKNNKIILFLGRIHEIKGLNLLIDAFSDLVKRYDNIKLVIAGPDDGYLKKLNTIIETLNLNNDIIFTGPLYERQKIEAYVDADVFLLPSAYESFGNVVFEAIACGTPVIVTDRCGVSDFVENKVGLVIEYDKSQLFNALNVLLSDEKLRFKFGKNGIKMANDQLGWNKISHNLETIYKNASLS